MHCDQVGWLRHVLAQQTGWQQDMGLELPSFLKCRQLGADGGQTYQILFSLLKGHSAICDNTHELGRYYVK